MNMNHTRTKGIADSLDLRLDPHRIHNYRGFVVKPSDLSSKCVCNPSSACSTIESLSRLLELRTLDLGSDQ
jgi:hypothetical protein